MIRNILALALLLTVSTAPGQSVMDDIRSAILKDNQKFSDLKVARKSEKVFYGIEFAAVTASMHDSPSPFGIERTLLLITEDDQKTLASDLFKNFSLFNGDLIRGEVEEVKSFQDGYLVFANETYDFPISKRIIHRAYFIRKNLKSLERLPFEEVSFTNQQNLGKQRAVTISFEERNGNLQVITETQTSKDGQSIRDGISKITRYRFSEEQRRLVPLSNSATLSRPVQLAGKWQQTLHTINDVEQRGAPMFEFDDQGNIIFQTRNNRTYQLDSKLVGKFELTADIGQISYSFTGMNTDYEGNIFFNEEEMIQEALAVGKDQFFPRSLKLRKVWYDQPYEDIRKKLNVSDVEITIQQFVNALYSDRADLVGLYVEGGFNQRISVNLFLEDTAYLGYPIHLVALTGKVDAMQEVLDNGMDAGLLSFNGKTALDFAEIKGDKEMIELLSNYKAPMDEELFRRNSLEYFRDFIRRQQGWVRDEGIVSVRIPEEKGEFLTVSVRFVKGDQGVQSDRCFYYQKDSDGSWILESERSDFPDRVRGECQNIFEVGGQTFLSTESKYQAADKKMTEFAVYRFNDKQRKFEKTNLVFTHDITGDFCDYTRLSYEAQGNSSGSGTVELKKITRVFSNCKETDERIEKSSYYWSDRQRKFLKTIE